MSRFLEPRTDDELIADLWDRIHRGLNNVDNELSNKRMDILQYYRGEDYGNEQQGYSKARTRQVFEAVEWTMTKVVEAFLGGGPPVMFKAVGPGDEPAAKQDTDIVHAMVKKSCFYEAINTWMRDSLINPNGYIKVWWEENTNISPPVEYDQLSFAQFGMLQVDPNSIIVDYELLPGDLFSVTVRYQDKVGSLVIEALPPEEVLVDNNATNLDLDKAELVVHHREVQRFELVEMGVDPELVEQMTVSNRLRYSTERESRRQTEDEQDYLRNRGAEEYVDVYECYWKVDQDGDGYSEQRRIVIAGTSNSNTLIENVEDPYMPIVALSTVPQPHRHVGESMAQTAMENQLIQSTLTRQLLDNLYRTNRPRTWAGRGVDTQKLNTYVPHGVVSMDDVKQIATETTQPIAANILPVFDYFEKRFELQTGVSRQSRGLDAQTLKDSPMSSYLDANKQATSRCGMLIRDWAEMGFAKLFCKIHYLMRTNQNIYQTAEVRGEWVDVHPSSWRERTETEAQVGLGKGNQEEEISKGLTVLEIQKEALPQGMTTPKRIYNNLDRICRAMGEPSASGYFVDPSSQEGQSIMQGIQQEKQQKEAQANQLMMAGLQLDARDKHTNRMLEAAELRRKIEADSQDHLEAMTKLELEYSQDVPGSAV